MDYGRRKLVTSFGAMSLALLSFRNLWARKNTSSNKYFVDKYRAKNQNASKLIKSAAPDDIIKESRRIAPLVSEVLQFAHSMILNEKITKLELQRHIIDNLDDHNLIPSMAGYNGFPAAIAISIDSELIHNIPDDTVILPSSLVTIEVGASSKKAFASQAWSFLKPPVDPNKKYLYRAAKLALLEALEQVKDGSRIGNIGNKIQTIVEERGYNVVREYCGYAMGAERILEPQILGYGNFDTGPIMRAGQILNIHVMANEGKRSVVAKSDGWGVKSKDGSNSVALSTMVLVKAASYELLSNIEI
jgi:methionyl aminopeptidase